MQLIRELHSDLMTVRTWHRRWGILGKDRTTTKELWFLFTSNATDAVKRARPAPGLTLDAWLRLIRDETDLPPEERHRLCDDQCVYVGRATRRACEDADVVSVCVPNRSLCEENCYTASWQCGMESRGKQGMVAHFGASFQKGTWIWTPMSLMAAV